jgi:hypothetical protein
MEPQWPSHARRNPGARTARDLYSGCAASGTVRVLTPWRWPPNATAKSTSGESGVSCASVLSLDGSRGYAL